MPLSSLNVQLTDLLGDPVGQRIDLSLARVPGQAGTGGESLELWVHGSVTDLTITHIPCRTGPGTTYRIRASAAHFRPYTFIQLIRENGVNTAGDTVEFWVRPGDVSGIDAPVFDVLPTRATIMLDEASMQAVETEDEDLLGLSGAQLYASLGPLRQACFLNVVRKASDQRTADNCLLFVRGLRLARQDRLFALVEPTLFDYLEQSPLFKPADASLHDPLPGYQRIEPSFKSRDAHANLQVTLMRHTVTGDVAADIDIDESSGIEHGFEIIRNAIFRGRTNPFLIREFLLIADHIERSLDPGYRFRF